MDTDPYVSAVGGNRLPELIRTVTLRLDEDVLKYATFLDTPGLRDPGMVQSSISGHQLLLAPANWCPMFASRATHRPEAPSDCD